MGTVLVTAGVTFVRFLNNNAKKAAIDQEIIKQMREREDQRRAAYTPDYSTVIQQSID